MFLHVFSHQAAPYRFDHHDSADWIARLDDGAETIDAVLRATYRQDWMLWRRRWRLYFLATAGLFGARAGSEWGVSHYRLRAM